LPVSESKDHIQGSLAAPVTLVEYGDYECPYCAQAYLITKEIQERLGDKLCLEFWDMYDYLFKHGQAVTNDILRRSAASLGLNLTRFDSEFHDRVYSNHIDEDIQSCNSSRVKGTPTVVQQR
jgi:protein-disulfide isomerase